MTYTQISFERFRGLNLRAQVETDAQGYAINGLDFDLDDGGVIRQRDGFDIPTPAGFTGVRPWVMGWAYAPASYTTRDYTLFAGRRNGEAFSYVTGLRYVPGLEVYYSDFAKAATGEVLDILSFGTTAGTDVFLVQRNQPTALLDMSGGPGAETITQPGSVTIDPITFVETSNAANTMPAASIGAVWSSEARAAFAGFPGTNNGPNGLVSSPHHVWFSEPGRPRAFRTDAFVVLSPGDGEVITAMKTWREFLFVFKETKFFVFQNVTSSSRGTPQFNYRAVVAGVGAMGARAVTAAPDGLYFASFEGLFVTRGGDPEPIGLEVQPLWTKRISAGFTEPTIDLSLGSFITLTYHGGRLLMSYFGLSGDPTTGRILVWDQKYDWWSIWKPFGGYGAYLIASAKVTGGGRKLFCGCSSIASGYASGLGVQMPPNTAARVDNGIAIPSNGLITTSYRMGFVNLADDSKVRVRQVEAWGKSAAILDVRTDFNLTTPAVQDDLLFDAPPNALPAGRALARKAFTAQRASLGFQQKDETVTTVPLKISRVVMHVSNKRVPSAL